MTTLRLLTVMRNLRIPFALPVQVHRGCLLLTVHVLLQGQGSEGREGQGVEVAEAPGGAVTNAITTRSWAGVTLAAHASSPTQILRGSV